MNCDGILELLSIAAHVSLSHRACICCSAHGTSVEVQNCRDSLVRRRGVGDVLKAGGGTPTRSTASRSVGRHLGECSVLQGAMRRALHGADPIDLPCGSRDRRTNACFFSWSWRRSSNQAESAHKQRGKSDRDT